MCLSFYMQLWTGAFERRSPDQPWPVARCLHTSAVLVDPNSACAIDHQKMITVWGKGDDNKHVEDIWLLDISHVTWKKVRTL